jgi:hypothetical protein
MPDEMIDLSARQMAKAARAIEQIVVSVAAAPVLKRSYCCHS